jgi:hypothetical protein
MSLRINLVRILTLFILVLGLGCSHKRGSSPSSTQVGAELRMVVVPLEKAENVLEEDARNFSSYLTGFLSAHEFFKVNTSSGAVADFSRKLLFESPEELRRVADRHLVEGVVSGKIHHFEYGLDRRNFFLRVDVSLSARNTYTGETFLDLRKNIEKRFRVRRGRKQDFSEYNRKALDELLGSFRVEFLHKLNTLVIAQKSRHKGVLPTRTISSVPGSSQGTGVEIMQILLWPVNTAGKPLNLPVPIRSKPQLAAKPKSPTSLSTSLKRSQKKKYIDPEDLIAKGELRETKPVASPSKVKVARRGQETPKPVSFQGSTSTQKVRVPSDREFNLKLPGFHLVYPRSLADSKKYQKFYYLVETVGSKGKLAVDLEDAGEETLILEVFSTVNRKAVGRFLEDYFRGLKPNPMGQMPTVFERDYMGKYQVGFPLENRVIIATGHRTHRDTILSGVSTLFVRNGGVSVARILNHSFKKGLSGANIVLEGLSTELSRKLKAPRVQKRVQKSKRRTKQASKNKGRTASQPSQPSQPKRVKKRVKKRAATKIRSVKETRRKAKKTKALAQKPDSSRAKRFPPDHQSRNYPANAVFFFDMGKGYYKSGDFDTAVHYFELAYRNGYDIPELQEYLERSELGKRKYGNVGLSTREKQGLPEFLGPRLEYETYDYSRLERQARSRGPSLSRNQKSKRRTPVQPESSRLQVKAKQLRVQPVKPQISKPSIVPKQSASSSNLEEFYREMQKMEQDIERYMKQKKNFRRRR